VIADPEGFIRRETRVLSPPHCPELKLHLADEAVPLWQATEEELAEQGLPPPFWAFAWAGGQGLARHILDRPQLVAGKRVLDFAAGSGLVGIAAMKAGAVSALCADIDRFANIACRLNAALNDVEVETIGEDVIGRLDLGIDVLLMGDCAYERDLATAAFDWARALAAAGVDVLIGDPGRAYMPTSKVRPLATYHVATSRDLEDAEVKRTVVWRLI
jgi:predicted nicotinamide N-methyase